MTAAAVTGTEFSVNQNYSSGMIADYMDNTMNEINPEEISMGTIGFYIRYYAL